MSQPTLAVHGRPAATIAAIQVMRAARLLLTVGVLAVGVWTAAPLLSGAIRSALPLPTPLPPAALPTAVASTLTAVQSAVAKAQQGGVSVPLALSLSDQDLTRTAAGYFPRTYAGVTVRSPNVRVSSGKIVVEATADTFLGSGPLVATATPYATGGKLLVRLDSATVAGIALPDGVRAQLTEQLQAAIDSAISPHLSVTTVTADKGALSLSGTALP